MIRLPVVAAAPSVALVSLGCAKNQVDSEHWLSSLVEAGFRAAPRARDADLVVVNTCGFIGPAKEESLDAIMEVVDQKGGRPGMRVMVTGCLYQRYPQIATQLEGVDYWVEEPTAVHTRALVDRLRADFRLPDRAPGEPEQYRRRVLLSEPGSAFLRISQGCDRTCSFCAIPSFKGPLASRRVDDLLCDVEWLAARMGVREVNLVAQDLTAFGSDSGRNEFLSLLRALDGVTAVGWYRLHYVYPLSLSRPVLDFLASSRRFARYIDMPVQHGDDEMLRIMRRGGTARSYLDALEGIRRAWPGVALRSTVIVGHPGETPRRFARLVDFLQRARLEWLGCFVYSREEGTASVRSTRRRVPLALARDRAALVHEVWRSARDLGAFGIGRKKDVLIVAREGRRLVGRSETEAPDVDGVIRIDGASDDVRPGQLVSVRLTGTRDLDFTGTLA